MLNSGKSFLSVISVNAAPEAEIFVEEKKKKENLVFIFPPQFLHLVFVKVPNYWVKS